MKLIPLTQGKFAMVDDGDWPELNKHKWQASYDQDTKTWRAGRGYRVGNKVKHVLMSRFIMGEPAGMVVDHVNHDTLDNQRCNLRICTRAENMQNQNRRLAWIASQVVRNRARGTTTESGSLVVKQEPSRAEYLREWRKHTKRDWRASNRRSREKHKEERRASERKRYWDKRRDAVMAWYEERQTWLAAHGLGDV
jgi:hypothetical protein